MAFELYAHVCLPRFTTDAQGNPGNMYPLWKYRRVLVATYPTKLLAQWWGINMKRVWLDPQKTRLVTANQIRLFEIVEVP